MDATPAQDGIDNLCDFAVITLQRRRVVRPEVFRLEFAALRTVQLSARRYETETSATPGPSGESWFGDCDKLFQPFVTMKLGAPG